MGRVFEHGPIRFGVMPPILKSLMVVNVVLFLLAGVVGPEFLLTFGLVPARVTEHRWVWQPFTYLFVHKGFFHLLFNLFAIWMFGVPVESQWGPREFFRFYMICGVGAGLMNLALTPSSMMPIIGASGAIYGLLVAFGMLYPDAVVYLYLLFTVKAWHMVVLFALLELMAGASGGTPTVANFAHLGGMAVAYVYIRWWWVWSLKLRALLGGLARERSEPPAPPTSRMKRQAARRPSAPEAEGDDMAEIDRILDKILDHGESSLTESERDILRRHGKLGTQGHA